MLSSYSEMFLWSNKDLLSQASKAFLNSLQYSSFDSDDCYFWLFWFITNCFLLRVKSWWLFWLFSFMLVMYSSSLGPSWYVTRKSRARAFWFAIESGFFRSENWMSMWFVEVYMLVWSNFSWAKTAYSTVAISTSAWSPYCFLKMIILCTSPYLLKTEKRTSALTGNLISVIVTINILFGSFT